MKSKVIMLFTAIFFTTLSCSKKTENKPDPEPGPGPGNEEVSTALLRRVQITSSSGDAGTFQYNADSTISAIVYSDAMSSSSVKFHYNNLKRIDFIEGTGTSGRADYYIDSKGRPTTIYMSNAISTTDYKTEFVYTGENKVSVSKLYWVTGGVSTLKFTNVYEYNASGLLTKITCTGVSGYEAVYTLENYGAVCNFNSWLFIFPTRIEELYELYNYPVLSSMQRLPGKITKTVSNAISRIIEQEFTIEKGRLNKMKFSSKYPGTTGLDYAYEMNLFY